MILVRTSAALFVIALCAFVFAVVPAQGQVAGTTLPGNQGRSVPNEDSEPRGWTRSALERTARPGNHARLGLGIGAFVGAGVGYAFDYQAAGCPEGYQYEFCRESISLRWTTVGGVVGGLVGYAIGSAIPIRSTRVGTLTLRLIPEFRP